jgi:hypothetical protein
MIRETTPLMPAKKKPGHLVQAQPRLRSPPGPVVVAYLRMTAVQRNTSGPSMARMFMAKMEEADLPCALIPSAGLRHPIQTNPF